VKHAAGDLIYWNYTTPIKYMDGTIEHGLWAVVDEISYDNDCRVTHHGVKLWVRPEKIKFNMKFILDDMIGL